MEPPKIEAPVRCLSMLITYYELTKWYLINPNTNPSVVAIHRTAVAVPYIIPNGISITIRKVQRVERQVLPFSVAGFVKTQALHMLTATVENIYDDAGIGIEI